MTEYQQSVGMMWLVWRDVVSSLAPHLDRAGLYSAITQLRSDPPALWAGIPEPWSAQRDLLRYQLVELAEAQGDPWPFLDDLPPSFDDASLSALLGTI
jgi:hypothetical protein